MVSRPVIPDLPAAPNRNDAPADFSTKADAFVAALPPMVTAENLLATWMNTTAAQVNADAIFANEAADRAEAVDTVLEQYVNDAAAEVVKAAAEVANAKAQADNAAASAAAAESAQGSIGNLALLHAVALSF